MSDHTQKQADEAAGDASLASSTSKKEITGESAVEQVPSEATNSSENQKDIPRWRQIEILQERAQLRAALDDLDAEFDEIDQMEQEVFGSDSENETLYVHGEEDAPDDDDELDDDVLDDEDFDDYDED